MLNFEICLLKVCNEDESFKSSVREFYSLMDDEIQEFSEMLVRFREQLHFCCFSKGNMKLHKLREGLNLVYMRVLCQYLRYT